ncbi:MAG: hypothetical protein IJQ47_08455 [Synergistaceae bacterium]|nr:hypothetical protein [Synergistaceae bacterium]
MTYKNEDKMHVVDATVTDIIKKNIPYHSGNIKNEFKIKTEKSDKEYLCVYWGHTNIQTGYKVQLKLWKFNEEFLLVDSIIITNKEQANEN